MTVLVVLIGLVVALLAVLVAGLLRSHADILRSLHELGVGDEGGGRGATTRVATPPSVAGRDDLTDDDIVVSDGVVAPRVGAEAPGAADLVGTLPGGGRRAVTVVGARHPTLLAFLSSGCATCAEFWGAFAAEDLELPGRDTRLVIVTKGPEAESPAQVGGLAPSGVTTLMTSEAWDRYQVPGSPYFALVDGPTGQVVGEGSGASWTQVAGLLRSAVADAGWAGAMGEPSAPAGDDRGRARAGGREREQRADAELLAAGITPGHESLYPDGLPQSDDPVPQLPAGEKPRR
jgi:hypothetical protein